MSPPFPRPRVAKLRLMCVISLTKAISVYPWWLISVAPLRQGMDYLHNSEIGAHGKLSSSNCIVNQQWRVKVTDYGLKAFKMTDVPDGNSYQEALGTTTAKRIEAAEGGRHSVTTNPFTFSLSLHHALPIEWQCCWCFVDVLGLAPLPVQNVDTVYHKHLNMNII